MEIRRQKYGAPAVPALVAALGCGAARALRRLRRLGLEPSPSALEPRL